MSLLQHFVGYPAKAVRVYLVCITADEEPQKERRLTIYCQLVNYLVSTYAADDRITKAKAELTNS